MLTYEKSKNLELNNEVICNDEINLFYQFFIHKNNNRYKEIKQCLKKNINNKFISKIYLLNERIYSDKELGIKSKKVIQVNIKNRLKYSDIYDFVDKNNIKGYIIYCNSDIFFDNSIIKLKYSNLHKEKFFLALLRYEFVKTKNNKEIGKIFGPRTDSQDTWIYHSNFNLEPQFRKSVNFMLGMPGCDNKITYLMKIFGYNIINCPSIIKTYHLHKTQIRNYTKKDIIPYPYLYIEPYSFNSSLQYEIIKKKLLNNFNSHTFNDNNKLYNFIKNKINNNKHFFIPQYSGIETYLSIFTHIFYLKKDETNLKLLLEKNKLTMKNNRGILLRNTNDLVKYSNLYINVFLNSELYSNWSPLSQEYRKYNKAIEIFDNLLKNKQVITSTTFDIYNFIQNNPWTTALQNKKILIISPFIDIYKEKEDNFDKIYNKNLFPNCKFIYLKSPIINENSGTQSFQNNLFNLTNKIKNIKSEFDIALVNCNGYGNLLCNEIFKIGKSAINVGDALQLYLGVYDNIFIQERKDIILAYLNKYWTRLDT